MAENLLKLFKNHEYEKYYKQNGFLQTSAADSHRVLKPLSRKEHNYYLHTAKTGKFDISGFWQFVLK